MFMEIEMSFNAFIIMLDSVNIDISVDINTMMRSAHKLFVETHIPNSDTLKLANFEMNVSSSN